MGALNDLLTRCKCGVHITVNEHRNYHQTAAQAIEEIHSRRGDAEPIAKPEIVRLMIETDTIVHVQCYPNTPIGFFDVFHHDVDAALSEAVGHLKG